MSYELAFMSGVEGKTEEEVSDLVMELSEQESAPIRNGALASFASEVEKRYPQLKEIGDADPTPWACDFQTGENFLLVYISFSDGKLAEEIFDCLEELATKYGVCVYDPQEDVVIAPGSS